jgi:glycosyltransferase involved in cell wall biosynthesis
MKSNPNVLIFAPAFAPNFFSEALVNSKLALAMLAAGWDVTVFSASASSEFVYDGEWLEPWSPLQRIVRQIGPSNPKSRLRSLCGLGRAMLVGRHPIQSAQWALRAAEAAIGMHQQRPFDLMLTRSTSCVAHLPGLIVKRRSDVYWIANWNDPPPYLFPAPYTHDLSPSQRFFYGRYVRDAARAADLNTFPSKRLMEYLKEPLKLRQTDRTAVVPHVGLGWSARPRESDRTSFRISHAGNLSLERDPRDFLRAFAEVVKRHPNIKFEFNLIGKMPDEIHHEVDRLGLANVVRYTLDLPFLACLEQMECADALLLIEAPVENGIFFPSKVVDYCEVGRPILSISPREGVMRELIDQYELAYFAEVGSVRTIQSALEQLISDWREDRTSLTGHEILRSRVRPKAVVEQLEQLILPKD